MAAGEPAPDGGAALAGHYEQLRARALGASPDGFRLGLAVLADKGMAAWIKLAGAGAPPAVPAPVAGPPVGAASAELVRVLAAMALRSGAEV